jgi:acetyl-CoA acetyltransferase
MKYAEKDCAITGIGVSQVGRNLKRTGLSLGLDAAIAAVSDAGLSMRDIGGVATYPGQDLHGPPGHSPLSVWDMKNALDLSLNWYCGSSEVPGQFGAIINACAAIALGLCRHVLVFRVLTEATAAAAVNRPGSAIGTGGSRVGGQFSGLVPYRAYSAANWLALYAQRHFHEFGTTREQLAQIALNGRRNAALNARAIYRQPLSLEQYLTARMISTPLCLNDCDSPTDAAVAVVVSAREALQDVQTRPVLFEAVGCATSSPHSWEQISNLARQPPFDAARMMWSRTDLKPKDVHTAQLYDGFSIIALQWLEALGFCGLGEGGPFLEGGKRIARDGELPLNTAGGQLSEGRLHAFGLLIEACAQLRNDCGERQITPTPRTAVVTSAGGPFGSCLLLRTD